MVGNVITAVGQDAIDAAAQEEAEAVEVVTTEESKDTTVVEENSDVTQPVVEGGDTAEESTDDADGVLYFADTPVEVEVPSEISTALKDAKIDESQLLKELFAKDGKFELSDKTRAALDKAFGKTIVDGYLGLYRQQNQITLDSHKKSAEEADKQIKENTEDFNTLTGGEDGWAELAEWATDNLGESDIAQFNAVMSLPAEHYKAQRAVVEALQLKRLHGLGDANGDPAVKLLTDSGGTGTVRETGGIPATMTREQFHAAMFDERYRKDPKYQAAVDASRQRGIDAEKKAARK